jgi:hypothetical protein
MTSILSKLLHRVIDDELSKENPFSNVKISIIFGALSRSNPFHLHTAGNSISTNISSIISADFDPEWNLKLSFTGINLNQSNSSLENRSQSKDIPLSRLKELTNIFGELSEHTKTTYSWKSIGRYKSNKNNSSQSNITDFSEQ